MTYLIIDKLGIFDYIKRFRIRMNFKNRNCNTIDVEIHHVKVTGTVCLINYS